MKIHKLTMQAFGPYADPAPAKVDFEALSAHGLFSISGPTGSGKSTILDAICYALFNATAGGERDARELRSQHAPPDLPTFVELEVSFGAGAGRKIYRFRRSPEQLATGARGRAVKQPAKATAHLLNPDLPTDARLLAEAVRPVNDLAHQLVRLDVDQFRKVVVLPQGKFAELLRGGKDNARARLDLFDVLFGTQWTGEFCGALQEAAKAGAAAVDKIANQRTAILQQQGATDADELLRKRDGLQTRQERLSARRDLVRRIGEMRDARLQKAVSQNKLLDEAAGARARLEQLNAELPIRDAERAALARAAQAVQIAPILRAATVANERLTRAEADFAASQARLTAAQNRLAEATKAAETIPVLQGLHEQTRAEIHTLEQAVIQFQRDTELAEAVRNAAAECQEADRQAAIAASARDRKAQAVDAAQTTLRECEVVAATAEEWRTKSNALAGFRATAGLIRELSTALETQKSSLESAHVKTRRAAEKLAAAEQQARDLTDRYLTGQAVVLAETLTAGTPCPVCGSVEHPAPAQASDDAPIPAKAEVDAALHAVELARNGLQTAMAQSAKIESELSTIEARISDARTSLGDWVDRFDELEAAWSAVAASLAAAEGAAKKLPMLRAALNAAEDQARQAAEAAVLAAQTHESAKQNLAAANAAHAQVRAQLPPEIPSQAVAQTRLENHRRIIAQQTTQIEQFRNALAAAQTGHATAQAAAAAAAAAVDQARKDDSEAQAAAAEALLANQFFDSHGNPSIDAAHAASIAPEALQQRLQRLQDFDQQLAIAADRAATLRLETEGMDTLDTAPLDHRLMKTQSRLAAYNERLGEVRAAINTLNNAVDRLHAIDASSGEVLNRQNALDWLNELFRLGRTGQAGINLPDFREYVIGCRLAPVIEQANHRFRRLSRGRYELRQTVTTVKSRQGAEVLFPSPRLMIHDFNTNQEREVSTLSGGETFQLSLSLALGLAESITEAQGGIQLDTVFIDEGFGTLDSESLDLAVEVLTDLRETGRTVGLISHVPELHERMTARLEIQKLPSGTSRVVHRV